MNWSHHRKNDTHFFDSSKLNLAEAETIASNYSTESPFLSIRRGDLPILVYFFPSLSECE